MIIPIPYNTNLPGTRNNQRGCITCPPFVTYNERPRCGRTSWQPGHAAGIKPYGRIYATKPYHPQCIAPREPGIDPQNLITSVDSGITVKVSKYNPSILPLNISAAAGSVGASAERN